MAGPKYFTASDVRRPRREFDHHPGILPGGGDLELAQSDLLDWPVIATDLATV